jgi:Double-GTPase 2
VAVLYILAGLVAGLLYLGYLACAVPIAAAFAFAVYGLGMPVAYLAGLWRVLVVRRPGLPARTLPARKPAAKGDADPAIVQYFYGPALTDADQAVRVAFDTCRGLWHRGARAVAASFRRQEALLTGPFGLGGAIGMAAGTAFGAVAAAGCALVHLLAIGVSAACVRAAGTVLRGVDSALLRVRNIRMVCPNPECYERVPYPAYECPRRTCGNRHRDVRPGRFGIVRRRCQCGEKMRTLLLFGSARMDAYCPYCGKSLEHRPGKAPEIVLPFFGATGAGKTRLVFSMAAQLRLWSEAAAARPGEARVTAELADTATAGRLTSASQWLTPGSAIDRTPPGDLPRAYVIRLNAGRGTWLLHMFDAAGEYFMTTGRTQELRYFARAKTFILVIDPLSVESFWDQLPPDRQAELAPVRSSAVSPDLAYQQAHQEIETMRVRLRKAHLAVVFSRADLIDARDGDVAAWAGNELGLGNLVRSAQLNFKEACFFRTAAVITDAGLHESVPVLIRWVLARNGVTLPGDLS